MVRFNGKALSGDGVRTVVAYNVSYGDGSDLGWTGISGSTIDVWTWHIYRNAGAYQAQFKLRMSDGTVFGGANRCAVRIDVRRPTVTPSPTPFVTSPVCGIQPPLFIVSTVQDGRRVQLTGLSRDSAPIDIQVKGPADATFISNGVTQADRYGTWVYTTTLLAIDGVYDIKARSGGAESENTVQFAMDATRPLLQQGTYRAGYLGYSGVEDTYISESAPLMNVSAGVTVSVRSDDVMNPLARFDLSGIPANATIVMAKLGLYSIDTEPCTNMVAASYELLRPWNPDEVTWITATQGITWFVPGANDLGIDRLQQPTYTETVKAPFTWYAWDVTEMAQNWVRDPGSNYGVIVKSWTYGNEVVHAENDYDQQSVTLTISPLLNGIGGRRDFAASEYPELRRRPALYITYVVP